MELGGICGPQRRNVDLRYYIHDGSAAFRFQLAGRLSDDGARDLEQAWRTASSTIGERPRVVDLSLVTGIDEFGRELLLKWHGEGATLVANRPEARELVGSIPGIALPSVARFSQAPRSFRLPRPSRAISLLLGLIALLIPVGALAKGPFTDHVKSAEILAFARYIASIQDPNPFTESGPVVVEIEASLPSLYKQSGLLAIRQMGTSKRSEYQVLQVAGDATVTQEVIVPYLAAQDHIQDLPLSSVAITPVNYSFHHIGEVGTGATSAYVFRITPKRHRDGLIQGQIWIDSVSGMAVLQAGHFVKSPSALIRRVEEVRDTKLMDGYPCVRITHAAIETLRAGRGELTITEYRLGAAGEKAPPQFHDGGQPVSAYAEVLTEPAAGAARSALSLSAIVWSELPGAKEERLRPIRP